MAFKVPASKKSQEGSRYKFEIDGTTYDVPLLKFAPVEAAEAFEKGHNVAGMIACCGDDEGAKAAIRAMDGEQLGALMEDWEKASQVSAGESSASTNS